MTSKVMTFRFPEALAEEIVSRSKATGKDRTAIVIEALAQAFNLSLSSNSPITIASLQQQLNQMEGAIAELVQQIAELHEQLEANSNLSYRLNLLEQAVTSLQGLKQVTGETLSSGGTP